VEEKIKMQNIKNISVIGAGDMGHGIAEVALIAGFKVFLYDIKQEFITRALNLIDESLKKLIKKNKITTTQYEIIKKDNLKVFIHLEEAVKFADLVIEAIPEDFKLKEKTFEKIDKYVQPNTLLATNTSTMSITGIAKATKRPDKFVGLHYFNPAVLMKTVEVIRGKQTSEETMQNAYDFCIQTGKLPIRVEKDVPGFIVNRVQSARGVLLGCIWDNDDAQPEEVDALMKKHGMLMGPFEIIDFAGLDIHYHARQYFAKELHPDFAPPKKIQDKVNAGQLGKKTGKGIYDWSNGRPKIDLSKSTDKVDPLDLIAVQINEATKLIQKEVCSANDIDIAIINATGISVGPVTIAKKMEPVDLTHRLNRLADRYQKEIFRPTKLIVKGAYR
jgi:enoyl-CoA hydratase / 3-hydroxyacyl-CoA dehydrogenase